MFCIHAGASILSLVCDFDQLEKEYKFYWKFDLKMCLEN
jgi:hypothetical protein